MPMGTLGSPDPNLDGRYEPYMDCLWTIEMPVNKAINLTFTSFDLESATDCRFDYVNVKNSHPLKYFIILKYNLLNHICNIIVFCC